MDLGLKNRVVLVTGASSGIGKAIAAAFACEGARVAITYRSNKAGTEETVKCIEEAGGEGFAFQMDLTEPPGIENAVAHVLKHWGISTSWSETPYGGAWFGACPCNRLMLENYRLFCVAIWKAHSTC